MKSTTITAKEAVSKEMKSLNDYLAIITAERAEQLRISKSSWRSQLTRIQAQKEVFRLDLEIAAKQQYLAEITESIKLSTQL